MSKEASKCAQERNAMKGFAGRDENKHHFYKCMAYDHNNLDYSELQYYHIRLKISRTMSR